MQNTDLSGFDFRTEDESSENKAHPADQNLTIVGLYDNDGCQFGKDLYVVASADGLCKIGRSNNPYSRLAHLRTHNAHELHLELILPGMGWQEKVWHSAFREDKARGEWFNYTAGIRAAVAAALVGDEWIATLTPPEVSSLSVFEWRERIADMEDRALDRIFDQAFMTPSIVNQGEGASLC